MSPPIFSARRFGRLVWKTLSFVLAGALVYAVPAEGGDRTPRPGDSAAGEARLARLLGELMVSADASANMALLPMASKLKGIIHDRTQEREMIVEGLIAIAQGENPRNIESRLSGFVS